MAGIVGAAPRVGQECAGGDPAVESQRQPREPVADGRVDAVVAKPITTEQLQPVVDRCSNRRAR